MIQLIYSSTAVKLFGPSDLRVLLVKARIVNGAQEITGMLLFHKGSFLQVLEGREENVDRIFGRIQADPRHDGIKVRSRDQVTSREFPTWSMGFMDTSGWPLGESMIGYNSIPAFLEADTTAKRYLRLFHVGLFRAAVGGGTPGGHVGAAPTLRTSGVPKSQERLDRRGK